MKPPFLPTPAALVKLSLYNGCALKGASGLKGGHTNPLTQQTEPAGGGLDVVPVGPSPLWGLGSGPLLGFAAARRRFEHTGQAEHRPDGPQRWSGAMSK